MLPIKVCFCVRNDFYSKFGGDTVQVLKYIHNCPGGFEAEAITLENFVENNFYIEKFDVFILVNLDRFYEIAEFYRNINRRRKGKIVLLPIHHSIDSMSDFFENRFGFMWRIIRLLGGIFFIEKAKSILYSYRYGGGVYEKLRIFMTNYRRLLKKVIKSCDACIFLAYGELNNVLKDFCIDSCDSYKVIRNGCDFLNFDKIGQARSVDVLVSGRVEPRKNQLEIAKALRGSDFYVVFIGSINMNNTNYFSLFKEIVDSSENLAYLGAIPSDEIDNYYKDSKVHISASWFEVSSLVDLEAYACGCKLVSSKNGHTGEFLGDDGIYYIDPGNLNELQDIVRSLVVGSGRECLDRAKIPSWDEVSLCFYRYLEEVMQG